jgi:hypothetical protein
LGLEVSAAAKGKRFLLVTTICTSAFTAEAHEVAKANVGKAAAKVDTIRARVDQRRIAAPIASRVY